MAAKSPVGVRASFWEATGGTVMVEAAFFIPVILFLLLAGADLARITQVSTEIDHAAAVIANEIAQAEVLTAGDMDTALLAAEKIIAAPGLSEQLSLRAQGFRISTAAGLETLWTEDRATDGAACLSAPPALTEPGADETAARAVNYYIVIDLCATPRPTFFLSGLLPAADVVLHGRALAIAATPAIRNRE